METDALVVCIVFDMNSARFFSCGVNGTLGVYDVTKGTLCARLSTGFPFRDAACWGTGLVTVGDDRFMKVMLEQLLNFN